MKFAIPIIIGVRNVTIPLQIVVKNVDIAENTVLVTFLIVSHVLAIKSDIP